MNEDREAVIARNRAKLDSGNHAISRDQLIRLNMIADNLTELSRVSNGRLSVVAKQAAYEIRRVLVEVGGFEHVAIAGFDGATGKEEP